MIPSSFPQHVLTPQIEQVGQWKLLLADIKTHEGIRYRKWTKETLSGQIYAVRKELEASENNSIADAGLQQVNIIEIITLLKNIRRDIMYGIFLICILLVFILIRIH